MPPEHHVNVIQELLEDLHRRHSRLQGGRLADYIPELARARGDDLGIAIATANGRIYECGDTARPFTIQSVSKPFIYALGLKVLPADVMATKIDVEPSGEAFNALSLDPATGRPRNPMINAGAIAASAQLCAADPENAERRMLEYFAELAGRPLQVDEAVYLSEKQTGHRNRAIGHLLRNFGIIESDPEPALDLYFRQCAIAVTCRDLAVMGATLACQGRNPFSGARPLTPEICVRVLALMGTCGMYDFAGQWLYDVGIPAKSGVAGGVMAVIPGRLAIATYSPPLDGFGNSVRGVAICREFSRRVGLSLFDRHAEPDSTIRRSYRGTRRVSRRWRSEREEELLSRRRQRIHVLHVQGVLDFAGLEQLAAELGRLAPEVGVLILDLAHVTECRPESSDLLDRQLCALEDAGIEILLSRPGRLPLAHDLQWAISRRVSAYDHLDSALEAAEDMLLAAGDDKDGGAPPGGTSAAPEPPPTEDFLDRLAPELRPRLKERMTIRRFRAGDLVIRQDSAGDELFLVRSGSFDIVVDLVGGHGRSQTTRLASFGPGTCFGEISFVAGTTRTADVRALEAGECWVLERKDFEALRREDAPVVIGLLQAITSDLGRKLSQTSIQLTQMEHS